MVQLPTIAQQHQKENETICTEFPILTAETNISVSLTPLNRIYMPYWSENKLFYFITGVIILIFLLFCVLFTAAFYYFGRWRGKKLAATAFDNANFEMHQAGREKLKK